MGFLRHIRSKSKSLNGSPSSKSNSPNQKTVSPIYKRNQLSDHHRFEPMPGRDFTRNLPLKVLDRIFGYVCPHALDNSYNSSEESMTEDGCMLCDMRDLAHCALTCRHWFSCAQRLLYQHVRIDAVHYCELEVELAAKRKKNSFFDRNADPLDAPRVRLLLFMRTVRESLNLGTLVLSLRMPYMTREASKTELARTVSVLPNLRYVDLPAGLFSDETPSHVLKQELMARCPEIRRMRYSHGSEFTFSQIPGSRTWMNIEVLEISALQIEPNILRLVLSSFPALCDLKLADLPWLEDSIFRSVPTLPDFPPVQRFTLQNVPHVTAEGLATYLTMPQSQKALTYLTLSSTGVLPQALHRFLCNAPRLRSLSVIQDVTRAFPMDNVPALSSRSLQLLHYEITSENGQFGFQPVAASYYTYLMSSLTSNALPALRDLYVRDAGFPDALLLVPPPRLFGGGESGPRSRGGLRQPLAVYSKGMDELEWNFTPFDPPTARTRRASETRPVSFHGAQLSPNWGGEARKSVIVGNGFGGFLAVPAEEGRPKSSGGLRHDQRQDLWR